MALAGAGLGLLLAWGTMRALSSLLFEVDPLNPALLAVAALLVVIVALLAAFVPTLQACKLNLTTALRYEG
jgi:ABC-type antimicrobial peptide transport system permease subunit